MRTRQLVVLAFLLASAVPGASQSSKPAIPTRDQPSKTDESKEAIVVERLTTRAAWEADGTGSRETVAVIRVQAESGVQALAVLTFPYTSANDSVDVEYVRVRKSDGTVIATPAYNIQDMPADVTRSAPMYSDLHEEHVTVKALGVGDTLEYAVRYRTIHPEVPGQFWFDYSFQKSVVVKDEELEVSVPREQYVNISSPGLQPKVKEDAARRVYIWTTANAERDEDALTQSTRRHAPAPSVQLSSFRTWDEVGRWYGGLQTARVEVTPAVRSKAAELTKGLTNDDEKIRALYDFVSTRFHYISLSFGIGRYQPHAADDVLDNQYGDCKDKHTLLAALLKAAGYDAWPALINSARQLTPGMASPGQFDHVITVLPRGGSLLWLDTTPEVAPYGLLLGNLRDKQALVIPTGAPPALMKTPADPPFPSRQTFSAEGKLTADGTFTGHVERSLRGDVEVLFRVGFRATSPAQWKDLVQNVSYASGFAGEVAAVVASAPDQTRAPFHFSYDYTRKDYGDWQNRRITPPLPPIGIEVAADDGKKPAEPFFLGAPGEVVYDARLELPAGDAVTPPKEVALVTDYAEYHAQYSFTNGVMAAARTFIIKKTEVPLAEWDDYRKFRKAVSDDEFRWIDVMAHDAAGKLVVSGADSTDPNVLNTSGQTALNAGNYPLALELLTKAVKADPGNKWAWNNLGLAYMRLLRFDEATAAFHKQIEINPDDAYAYNNLGQVLQFQGKPEEASQAFRKQISVSPRDRWAHANLGALLVGQKKYNDAVPELETAADIDPQNSNVQMTLGQAYLELGQADKAMSALDKAVQTGPSPPLLNNVAYILAEKGEHLDKARQFAESAVSSLDGLLRDVQLKDLQLQHLLLVNLLGQTWDTLGWVHFRQGSLERAQKYLAAAWNLNQNGVMADHLGQVYEKQGKKEAAARLYAEALASLPPAKEARQRLVALVGSEKEADVAINKARERISQMRTTTVAKIVPRHATAEFFVSFSPGPKVDEVEFISGDEQLRKAVSALTTVKYDVLFPDAEPTRLVRRGILACADASSSCEFVLMLPGSVQSVN